MEKLSTHWRPALTWITSGVVLCALLTIAFFTNPPAATSPTDSIAVNSAPTTSTTEPVATNAAPIPESSQETVAPTPPPPTFVTEAFGRLDVEFLSIPSEQLDHFKDLFDQPGTSDLTKFLKDSGGKVIASASAGIRTGAEPTSFQIGDGQFAILAQVIPPDKISVEGRFNGSFSSSFNCLLQPGTYQLLVLVDQPPQEGTENSFNVIVARLSKIEWVKMEKPCGIATDSLHHEPNPPASMPPPSLKLGRTVYMNRGDNTDGFVVKLNQPNFTVRDNTLVGNDSVISAGWFALPAWVTGDFQIDFDVYPDANDAASALMLFDDASNKGILIFNCTQTTFMNHNISIYAVNDLQNGDQFYFNHNALATAEAKVLTNQVWAHVTITKRGNTLTDNVGGQIITADLSNNSTLPARAQVGLGYYASKNVGGNGQIKYKNIRIVQVPRSVD